jgi:electron transfer flavoprotein alpha subunit
VILVVVTHDRGELEPSALQAVTFARGLGAPVHAVVVGSADGLVTSLADHGVAVLHVVEIPGLDDYAPAAWASAVARVVETSSPVAVVAPGSDRGNEVMAHVGALTGLPFVANCVEVEVSDGPWSLTRTRWGGSLLELAEVDAPLVLLSVTEHSIEAAAAPNPVECVVEPLVVDVDGSALVTRVVDRVPTAEGVTLATAPIVVSGGRGVGSAEGFAMLEDLAEILGGVVGCSRVVTNNGWRPHSDQVGQTGTVVAPDLYIACGISGAIQHWVGMMASKTVLAINTDPEAPMVTKADYAMIGDLHEIVPAIVAELRNREG